MINNFSNPREHIIEVNEVDKEIEVDKVYKEFEVDKIDDDYLDTMSVKWNMMKMI